MTTGKCYVARSTDVAARMIGGEMMIMSGRDASLFCLNETASLLWSAADGQADIDQIAALVCAQYDVAPDTARDDLLQVARELAAHRLIVLSETPVGGAAP
ncbi:PqqD family protein [Ramlibacter sp.]|uniref:PqqD family protein n=1 Tax=Ramlibacter sp. TaxID=1917967 RepID=UPI001822467F|nr:PqqD family protein [Ramlibacter sp.]MBA2673568.1 PqqD family protein [Ramlibacter sp.]